MRITDAWVSDPLVGGKIAPPELNVQIDSLPNVTVAAEVWQRDNEVWQVARHGPFIKYERLSLPHSYEHWPVDETLAAVSFSQLNEAGAYNSFFAGIFPPIVDIFLISEEKDHYGWATSLSEARRLLRKYDNKWKLVLSDRAAQTGKISWRLQEVRPPCKHFLFGSDRICGTKPTSGTVTQSALDGPVEIPLCAQHLREFNNTQASRRVATSG